MPNAARIYDYYLGGRENFQADRVAADELAKLVPGAEDAAHDNRAFLHRAVRFLAEQGISQFLDIGAGMPGMPGTVSVLDVAREVHPDARVAYVDYDPIVVSHCGALLARPGQAVVVQADVRQPETLLAHPSVRGLLDFRKPVGVLLVAVLHYVSDDDHPARIMSTLRDALAPGSYLAIGHVSHDHVPRPVMAAAVAAFAKSSASIWPRSANQVRHLFDGFDLVEPGLVPQPAWRPDGGTPPVRDTTFCLGGVALKT